MGLETRCRRQLLIVTLVILTSSRHPIPLLLVVVEEVIRMQLLVGVATGSQMIGRRVQRLRLRLRLRRRWQEVGSGVVSGSRGGIGGTAFKS